MQTDINRLLYDQRIQMLQDQINHLNEQIQVYKKKNDVHQRVIQELNEREHMFTLELNNRELEELLEIERKKSQELQQRRYEEVKFLKEEIKEKNHEIQIIKIQHQKQLFRAGEQIRHLKYQLKNSKKDNLNIDQLSRSLAISSSCLNDIRNGDQNYLDRSNNLSIMNLQKSRKKSTQSRLSNMQKSNNASYLNSSKNQFFNYSKDQLKIAMKTLNKAGKSLREGSIEASILQGRQSYLKFSKK